MAGKGAATSEKDKLVDKDNLFRRLSIVPMSNRVTSGF